MGKAYWEVGGHKMRALLGGALLLVLVTGGATNDDVDVVWEPRIGSPSGRRSPRVVKGPRKTRSSEGVKGMQAKTISGRMVDSVKNGDVKGGGTKEEVVSGDSKTGPKSAKMIRFLHGDV